MALTRRGFLLGVSSTGLLAGCAATHSRSNGSGGALLFTTQAKVRNARAILVIMPETRQTKEVWTGLSDELGKEYDLIALRGDPDQVTATIARGIERYRPSGLVLMNNPTVAGYRRYQRQYPQLRFPPTVIVMSSFLEGRPVQLSAATGISYEVPLITVVTNLRKLIATPIDRVGVIHRPGLRGFVHRQATLAEREQTRVVAEEVSLVPNASEIKHALRKLKQKCDVLWVLNDDRLLTPRLIADAWLPGLNEAPWVPSIVGAASLVSPERSFGTFAVLPDHTALGSQAATLMLDIADHEWEVSDSEQTQLPLSTTTTVDLPQVKERFQLRKDALSQVDRVLEK